MRVKVHDLLNFLFPAYCPVCGIPMYIPRQVICLPCEVNMPMARYTGNPENPVSQLFWGRTRIEEATSLFRFEKGSRYQRLLHQLKYSGDERMGNYLGKLLGAELENTPYGQCDLIVPVPLHPKKKRQRGFNQSEVIAAGVASILDIPLVNNVLFRSRNTSTQTRKSRYERFKNMDKMFRVNRTGIRNVPCSVLLIDDVVTTGSTLEACIEALLQVEGLKVYVATVACA